MSTSVNWSTLIKELGSDFVIKEFKGIFNEVFKGVDTTDIAFVFIAINL